jgi:hypothetical protein
MSVYRRKDAAFNTRLAVRHDELSDSRTAVIINGQGQVVILAIPYLTFPTTDCAERFVRRVLQRKTRRSQ